jgi:hypothetical protein
MPRKKMEVMYAGEITGFSGSWMSGMADLLINGFPVPVDNAETVRSLEDAFGDTIADGHMIKPDGGYMHQRIVFEMDGMMMKGFSCEADFLERKKQNKWKIRIEEYGGQ